MRTFLQILLVGIFLGGIVLIGVQQPMCNLLGVFIVMITVAVLLEEISRPVNMNKKIKRYE